MQKDYSGALEQLVRNWKQGKEERMVEDYPSMYLADHLGRKECPACIWRTIWEEKNVQHVFGGPFGKNGMPGVLKGNISTFRR